MPEPEEGLDPDFDAQMRGLFEQAEKVIETRAREEEVARAQPAHEPPLAPKPQTAAVEEEKPQEARPRRPYPNLPQMLRPIVLGLEAVSRAAGENTSLLQKLDRTAAIAAETQRDIPQLVLGLREVLEQKNGVNQRMFDALHQELKGYKDGFLLETVHRPIIRDLISLYDDLAEIHRQIGGEICEQMAAGGMEFAALIERMKTMETNVGHKLEFIVEVLARLEVTLLPVGEGKLDKRMQRAVAVEITEDVEEDTLIVRTAKRGFAWNDRVLRAEEVVMKKWKPAFTAAFAASAEK